MLKRLLAKKLSPIEIEQLAQKELLAILSSCQPQYIYLFGSASRGEMTEDSDLDFLVALRDEQEIKAAKTAYYGRKRDHSFPVDIIFMDAQTFATKSKLGGVAMICLNEGRLLYEAQV